MSLLCCCLGLRISECLALKWGDRTGSTAKLTVERSIVCQQVDDVKTAESHTKLVADREFLAAWQGYRTKLDSVGAREGNGRADAFFSFLTGGWLRFTGISVCPVFTTDERFVLLSLIPPLHWSEQNGEYLTPKTTSVG
jgi:hypothetical protein